ncbi:hypothetical protein [Actinomyces capricornis]|uniref:Lipoprotein n=1 Tax=Actinomyces capricornis TaxID=2755559 RepID=A0ABM7UB13_9ACTO|nr:hypothetical protein [Actinomyces capricornis]BDA64462.1 hypothetical protein MANAM107_12960 [Actinomyces capricornis]
MPRRHRSTAALVLVVSLIAAGCASGDGRGQDAPSMAAGPSASADPVPLLTTEPMDDLGAITPSWSGTYLPPTWDQEAEDAAVQRASQTMTAYLAGTDQETWWQGLLPHLTPEAQAVYRYTDATRVPPATVDAGRAALISPTDEAHLLTALVQVPTDKGVFGVVLTRQSGSAWLTRRIVLPGDEIPEGLL